MTATMVCEQWQLHLERGHLLLRQAGIVLEKHARPLIDLEPGARSVEEALGSLYDAFDERADRLTATRRALQFLDQAAVELHLGQELDLGIATTIQSLQRARAELALAETAIIPLIQSSPKPPARLLASRDTPRLHRLARPSLRPQLRVATPPPPEPPDPEPFVPPQATNLEELDAAIEVMRSRAQARREGFAARRGTARKTDPEPEEDFAPPPGFSRELPDVVAPLDLVAARARECFEDVAMLGMQRAPLLGDPWRSSRFLEDRLLWSLDAVVALGPHALAQLEGWVRDAPAKDPARVFAIGMVLGCVEGRDALAAAERAFIELESDPEAARHFAAALKLVPHPQVPLVLRTLLADPSPTRRALAIDVLGYRQLATVEELQRAATDVPEVATVALPLYALVDHNAVREPIAAALEVDSAPLRSAAWLAMVLADHPRAVATLRPEITGEQAERAAQLLALVSDASLADALLEQARLTPTRPLVTAVGWAGAATAIVPLMSFLEHEEDAVKLAAAYALDRITGAGLYESTEVESEEIEAPEVPDPNVNLGEPEPPSLVKLTSDPRDEPPRGSLEALEQPTTDINRWRAYWEEKQSSYDLTARYRRGMPYCANVSLGELDWARATPGERRLLVHELVIRTGQYVPLDPHDFISVQEAALKEWAPIAARASSQPGSFARASRR